MKNSEKYHNYKYEKHISDLINGICLTDEDYKNIDSCKKNVQNIDKKVYAYIFKDIYKLAVKCRLSTSEIAKIYNTGERTVQIWKRDLGINKMIPKRTKNKNSDSNKCIENKEAKKRKFTNKGKYEYYDFSYKEEDIEVVQKVSSFTEKQTEELDRLFEVWGESKYKPIIEDIYKFWINGYSPDDLGRVYGKSNRLFQAFFKKADLSRDRFEAQAIAKTKRDYKQIQLKSRETLLKKNTYILGSSQEQYIRNLLNCRLPMSFPNCEIIVGLNNKSILEDGLEIDIPIIIFHKDKIIKIAVEYDGYYWHDGDKDRGKYKSKHILNKNYKLFIFKPKQNATEKQILEYIDVLISEIEKYIRDNITN